MICEYVDGNFITWGNCLIDGYFFGNPLIYAFAVFVFFMFASYKLKVPGTLSIPLGVILIFSTSLALGGTMSSVMLLSILLTAGYVGYIIITKIMRP